VCIIFNLWTGLELIENAAQITTQMGNGGHHLAFGKSIGMVIALLAKQ
jgi:hypothetical protein